MTTLNTVIPRPLKRVIRRGIGKAQSIALRGDGVECPAYGLQFRKFLPHGQRPRPGAACPECRVFERHRLEWLFPQRDTPVPTAKLRVLRVAPEPGIEARLRALDNLDLLTGDIEPGRGDVEMDIAAIDFRTALST